MTKLFKFFVFLMIGVSVLGFQSCGDDDYEPEPPNVLYEEGTTIARNSDGSYLTISPSYLMLFDASGRMIAMQNFSYPEPIDVDFGYGNIVPQNYHPMGIVENEEFVSVIFSSPVSIPVPGGKAYVYKIEKHLKSVDVIPVELGTPYVLGNGEFAMLSVDCLLYIYDESIRKVHEFTSCKDKLITRINSNIAIGEVNDIYYALGITTNEHLYNKSILINFSNGNEILVDVPDSDKVRQDFFPEIETNKLQIGSDCYAFNNDLFEVKYKYTLYSGEEGYIIYKFDITGSLVSSEIKK